MSIRTSREGDDVVLRIPAGAKAGGFARFLEQAALAFENGKLLPTNLNHQGNILKAADSVRDLAARIHRTNS